MQFTKALLILLIGIIVGAVGYSYLTQAKSQSVVSDTRESAKRVGETVKDSFDAERIKDELARTGKVVRDKADKVAHVIADATANARVTATIKTKLLADSGLSALKINVDTADGVVTLSGTVRSVEDVARAMQVAMEVDGVRQVVSTLLVKPS